MSKFEVEFRKIITREQVQTERRSFFIFGDNMERRGLGGQAAAMRGEPNAFGIPTKRKPTMEPDAFFTDQADEIAIVLRSLWEISGTIDNIESGREPFYDKIVWPMDGIGSGLAKLVDYSPYIWVIIQHYQNWLRKYVNLD